MSDLLRLTADVRLEAGASADQPARVSILAYSGRVMSVSGFGDVIIVLAGLKLPGTIPLLADHDSTLGGIAGSGTPVVRAGALLVEGTLAAGVAGDRVRELARAGVPLEASVGVEPTETSRIGAGMTSVVNGQSIEAGPRGLLIVKAGRLREVSVVPLGADASTSVHVAAKAKGIIMSDDEAEIITQGDPVAAERARIREIRTTCSGEPREELMALEAKAIEEGLDLQAVKAAALDLIRRRASWYSEHQGGAGRRRGGSGDGYGGGGNPRDVLTAAALLMGGHGGLIPKYVRDGERLANALDRPSGWPELCALALRLGGRPIPHDRLELLKGGFSTMNMPQAIGAGIEKVALDVFLEQSRNWTWISRIINASSFKPGKAVRLAANTRLDLLPPGGEIKHGSLNEDSYDYKLDTYAKMITIDRQALINDDLQVLTDLPVVLGGEAARTASDLIFGELAGADGNTFFTTGRGNLITETVTVNGLGNAITKLRTQKDQDGRVIGFIPKFMLVPAALEGPARQVVQSQYVSRTEAMENQPTSNPWWEGVDLLIDARLDTYSTLQWYLFAAGSYGSILVALLGGRQGIVVEEEPLTGNHLGMSWRAYMDIGVSLGDYRAAVRSDGTGP